MAPRQNPLAIHQPGRPIAFLYGFMPRLTFISFLYCSHSLSHQQQLQQAQQQRLPNQQQIISNPAAVWSAAAGPDMRATNSLLFSGGDGIID